MPGHCAGALSGNGPRAHVSNIPPGGPDSPGLRGALCSGPGERNSSVLLMRVPATGFMLLKEHFPHKHMVSLHLIRAPGSQLAGHSGVNIAGLHLRRAGSRWPGHRAPEGPWGLAAGSLHVLSSCN